MNTKRGHKCISKCNTRGERSELRSISHVMEREDIVFQFVEVGEPDPVVFQQNLQIYASDISYDVIIYCYTHPLVRWSCLS